MGQAQEVMNFLYRTATSAARYDLSRRGHPDVIERILRLHPLPDKGRVADFGCGTGNETIHFFQDWRGRAVCIDKSKEMLLRAKEKISSGAMFVVGEGGRKPICEDDNVRREISISFQDETFSYIFSSFTYHHMESKEHFLSEIRRILEPNGKFVLLGATLEQALDRPLLKFFPQLADVESKRYLRREELIELFWKSGFCNVTMDSVPFEVRAIDESYLDRVQNREMNSALQYLTEEAFLAGLVKIKESISQRLSFQVYRTVVAGVRPLQWKIPKERSRLIKKSPFMTIEISESPLPGGKMNSVHSARLQGSDVIFKQGSCSSPSDSVGNTLRSMSPERICDEFKVLTEMNKRADWGIEVPSVIAYDRDDNILLLKSVGRPQFLMSNPDVSVHATNGTNIETLGSYLGKFHSAFLNSGFFVRDPERDLSKWKWAFNLRTRSLLIGDVNWPEEFAANLESKACALEGMNISQTLVNPDYCPKNIFVWPDSSKISVFDFEFCCGCGDPAYDLGFMLAHLIIMAKIEVGVRFLDSVVDSFLSAYARHSPLKYRLDDIVWYAACTVLYRKYGVSKWPSLVSVENDHPIIRAATNAIIEMGEDHSLFKI